MHKQHWTLAELQELKEQLLQSFQFDFEALIVHEKLKILAANQTAGLLFGYEPAEMNSKTIMDLVTPEVRSLVLMHILQKYQKPYEAIAVKKNGQTFPVEICGKTISFRGRIITVMGLQEITGRRAVEVLETVYETKSKLDVQIREAITELILVKQPLQLGLDERWQLETLLDLFGVCKDCQLQLELDERRQLETQLKARVSQQAAIAELGQRALVGTDLSVLMEETVSLVAQTLNVEYVKILKLILPENILQLQAGIGWPAEWLGQATVGTGTHSQAGFALLSHKPVVVEDLTTETRFTQSALCQAHPVVSGMSVIIQGQRRSFGVLEVHSARRRNFSEDDIHFLQAMANVLAMAIERKENEIQLGESSRKIKVLRQAGAALNNSLDYEEVLDLILEQVGQVVPHNAAYLMLVEGDVARLFRWYSSGQGRMEPIGPVSFNISDTHDFYTMQETGRPLVIPDTEQYEAWVYRPETAWIKSYAATPIYIRGQLIGFLGLGNSITGFYNQTDAEQLEDFANQAAIAIENAQLFNQNALALEDMSTLYRVARLLAQLDNEQEMFELVLTEYLQRLNLQQGGVLILDEDKAYGTLKARMFEGRLVEPGLRIPIINNPACKQLIATQQPVVIYDVFNDMRLGSVRELTMGLGIKSLLLIPIIVRDEVIGALGADATRSHHHFTEREISLVEAVANQLSIAIESIRLHYEAQRRADQMITLHELDRAIATSLRLTDIYHAFAHHAAGLLPYDRLCLALVVGEEIEVAFVAGKNKEKGFLLPVGSKLPRKNSAIGWVIELSQPLLRHDIVGDNRFAEDECLGVAGTHSVMIIPLRIKGHAIGTWSIAASEVGAYSPDDLRLAQAMADQLAVAIENARLYEQAQQEIAERKRAEAALAEERTLLAQRVAEQTADLREVNAELARASRLKDEFLASMSHELRTPLTAILGLSEVLKIESYGPLTERQLKAVSNIEESGRHLLSLINDILDLSKIEAGKMELQIGPVSVQGLCQASLQFVKQMALKKQLKMSATYDPLVTRVQADERRLKQILVNLLSNAVKFTPAGGQIGLEVKGDEIGQTVNFTVWDTGIGISPEDLARLFQPFVQLDSSLSRQYAGTGLGLALTQRMINLHGGNISVQSTPGQGSRFTVLLPLSAAKPEIETAPAETEKVVLSAGKVSSAHDAGAPLILLAEDEDNLSQLFGFYIQNLGYRLIYAENGLEALEQARQAYPDLIIMDVQMPELDGLEATRRLRVNADFATVPIIMLTAMAMPGDRERCLLAGATEYLSKPVILSELGRTIQKQLGQYQTKKEI